MKKILLCSIILSIPVFVFGAVLEVPAVYPDIQAGIDAAENGDTVLVADGLYAGAGNRCLELRGKAITVRSENGYQNCTITADYYEYGFHIYEGEGPDCVIEGFTIQYANLGGIRIDNASPTINACRLDHNYCGGMVIYDGDPMVERCIFSYNVGANGGGMLLSNASPSVINCTFRTNSASSGGAIYAVDSGAEIVNCIFYYNISSGG